LVSADRAFE